MTGWGRPMLYTLLCVVALAVIAWGLLTVFRHGIHHVYWSHGWPLWSRLGAPIGAAASAAIVQRRRRRK